MATNEADVAIKMGVFSGTVYVKKSLIVLLWLRSHKSMVHKMKMVIP